MLDGLTLDQVRTFIAAADAGSFSEAGRRLHRAQSVVSQTLANLEGQVGVALFDRSGRYPKLTPEGHALLADARKVAEGVDALKARARGMVAGLEPELSVVIDVMFPMQAVTHAARLFAEEFPQTPLRLYVEVLGAAFAPVLDGRCGLGVVGSLALMPPGLTSERLTSIPMVTIPLRPLMAPFPELNWSATSSWSSPTAPPSPKAASSASSPPPPGAWPTSPPSTPSCWAAWAGAACLCWPWRTTSPPAASSG